MADNKTRAVRSGEELNEVNLKTFLKEKALINDASSELVVTQFSHGYSNLTYLLQIEEQEYVLRRPPFAAPKRGHDMSREYKVLSNLIKGFDKIPTAYTFTEDADVIGAPFYIMSKVEGEIITLKEAKKKGIQPEAFKKISSTWIATFVSLHTLDYKALGLEDLGKPEGYVARQVTNWGKQYLKAATEDVPAAKKVMAWMEENQPKTYEYSLIHNDYKYDNVVFKDDSWNSIVAILDWEMCTLGDPLMDLGTSLGYWTTSADPDFMQQWLPSPTILEGNPSRMEIVEQYINKSGKEVNHLTFYFVYGLFKIAVIAQQIYYRYKHGHTSDPRFAALNKAAELCCTTALQAIQKNRIDNLF